MKRITLLLTFALICALILSLTATPVALAEDAAAMPSGTADDAIGAQLDDFLSRYQTNHAAVATTVFRGEQDVYTRYFGYLDTDGTRPLTADSVLEWGSTTKLTVWVSAMQLVVAGKLDLSRDIRDYLPQGFFKHLRYDEPITMRNLMNHNAGFQETDFVLEVTDAQDIIPLSTYMATYQPRQVFAPGQVVAYSNWGAALAGYVVECIVGVPFWQYVKQNVFAPLGMTHSAIAPDYSDNQWVADRRNFVSYAPTGELFPDNKVYILPYPAGSCISTLDDFARFAKALLTKDSRLMPAEGYELMYSPSLYYTDTQRARLQHGFLVDYEFATPIVGHDGNTAGCSSRLMLDFAHGIGMVVLTNQLGGSLYRTKMAELVFGKGDNHAQMDGYYQPARTVLAGKDKYLYNLFSIDVYHITSRLADGLYVNVLDDRLEISATDYLAVSPTAFRARDAVTVVWFALLAYAALTMLVRFGVAIAHAVRKQPTDRTNLLGGFLGLLMALGALSLLPSLPAAVVLAYVIVAGLACCAFVLYLLRAAKLAKDGRWHKVSYLQAWTLLLCYALTLANVVIWDLALL